MRNRRRLWVAAAQLAVLAGCVPAVMAPTVVVTPGPGKSSADFATDHTACAAQANQQMAPAIQAANSQIVGNAVLGAAFGGGSAAAAGGSNSAVGASAAAGGTIAGAANAQTAQVALQQQFNVAYSQCMYAKGDIVPGMTPAAAEEPAPVTHHARHYAHKTPPATASSSASSTSTSTSTSATFVEPAPVATGGGGFVQPQPAAAGGSSGFALPPPASH